MSTAEATQHDAAHDGDHDHGHDHPEWLAHHFESPEQQFDAGKLGIWLFLAQEVLFFTGLFVAYAVYRMNHPEVFTGAATHLNPTLGALNTIVLLASSLAIAWGVRCVQKNQQDMLLWMHIFTLACAGLFMGVKIVEYSWKFDEGLYWAGMYNPTHLVPGEGLHAQLHWAFLAMAVIGGAITLGGWMMWRLASSAGMWIAMAGWALSAYIVAAGLAPWAMKSIQSSQVAASQAAAAAVETAQAELDSSTELLANETDEGERATAKTEVDRLETVYNSKTREAELAKEAIWTDGMLSFMSIITTLALTALIGWGMWAFTGCFRGDRKAWGAVALGLGSCIAGTALGIVVARGIQLNTPAHHDDAHAAHGEAGHHDSAGHDSAGHDDSHDDDHSAPAGHEATDDEYADGDHAEGEHGEAGHSEQPHAEEGHAEGESHDAPAGDPATPGEAMAEAPPASPSPVVPTKQIGVNQGNFFSIYFAMTGVHALHIFAGIVVIAWIIGRIARGDFGPEFYGPVEFVGLYWHLVDLVWIYLFPLLYLIH